MHTGNGIFLWKGRGSGGEQERSGLGLWLFTTSQRGVKLYFRHHHPNSKTVHETHSSTVSLFWKLSFIYGMTHFMVNNLPMNCSWAWYNQNFINYICIYVAFLKLRIDETVLNNMFFFNCKSSLPHKNMQRYKTWTGSSHLYIVKTINIHCCLVSGSLR